jgi:hypothetical protein
MKVSDPNSSRFRVALDLLLEGRSLEFENVTFWLEPKAVGGYLFANITSSWQIRNVSRETALSDLRIAKRIVETLTENNADFAALLRQHPLQFILTYDYGNGRVELGRFEDDDIVWSNGFTPEI